MEISDRNTMARDDVVPLIDRRTYRDAMPLSSHDFRFYALNRKQMRLSPAADQPERSTMSK